MPLDTQLQDGHGTKNKLRINGEGEASVVVHPHPPKDEAESALPFRQYFTLDGTSSGDNDMRVDGSTNNVEFCIPADPEKDVYIKTISILISDAGATLSEFGNLAALSNGIEFKWTSQEEGDLIIADALTTNFEFVRLANGNPGFGDGTTAFQAGNISGTSEGYLPVIDMSATFGLAYGVRLRKGSTEKLVFTIKDNIATLDAFNIIGYGIKW
jgi:hypothetical protein